MCRDDVDAEMDGPGEAPTRGLSLPRGHHIVETLGHKMHKKPMVKSPVYLGINIHSVRQ